MCGCVGVCGCGGREGVAHVNAKFSILDDICNENGLGLVQPTRDILVPQRAWVCRKGVRCSPTPAAVQQAPSPKSKNR